MQPERERKRELREGWSTRGNTWRQRVEANDEVWEKNLIVSAQDKSNLITITDEKKEIYQIITEMRTRTTSRRIEEQGRQQGIELIKV